MELLLLNKIKIFFFILKFRHRLDWKLTQDSEQCCKVAPYEASYWSAALDWWHKPLMIIQQFQDRSTRRRWTLSGSTNVQNGHPHTYLIKFKIFSSLLKADKDSQLSCPAVSLTVSCQRQLVLFFNPFPCITKLFPF